MKYKGWKKRDWTKVDVRWMTDLHLLHTIRSLVDGKSSFSAEDRENWETILKAEAIRRGLDWREAPTRRVRLLDAWESSRHGSLHDFFTSIGVNLEVDVTASGQVVYLHWATGPGIGTPVVGEDEATQ